MPPLQENSPVALASISRKKPSEEAHSFPLFQRAAIKERANENLDDRRNAHDLSPGIRR